MDWLHCEEHVGMTFHQSGKKINVNMFFVVCRKKRDEKRSLDH